MTVSTVNCSEKLFVRRTSIEKGMTLVDYSGFHLIHQRTVLVERTLLSS